MTKSLGVAVVGAGDMGRQHAQGWSTLGNVELIAVVDPIRERAMNLKREYGFETCTDDYRKAIDREDVDIVSVCTPAYYHPEITIYAAERGKHVLCEKPLALTLKEADEMIRACRKNGVFLEVGFQRRYMERYVKLKDLIQGGTIGRPTLYVLSSAVEIRPKRAMHDLKRGNGGPIIDTCCHFFDIWRVLFSSEPIWVMTRGFTFAEGRPELTHIKKLAPDTASLNVEYESKDLGVIIISWGLPPGLRLPGSEYILGSKGAIVISHKQLMIKKEGGKEEKITFNPVNAKVKQVHYFARVVLGEAEPRVSGEDGKVALKVSLAALKSMRTKRPVTIKET